MPTSSHSTHVSAVFISISLLIFLAVIALNWVLAEDNPIRKLFSENKRIQRHQQLVQEFFSCQNARQAYSFDEAFEPGSRHYQDLLKREVQAALRCARISKYQWDEAYYLRWAKDALDRVRDSEFVARYRQQVEQLRASLLPSDQLAEKVS